MSLLHSLHRNVKTIAMPMGMVVGALLCRPVTAAESMSNGMITPTLIFLMLFSLLSGEAPADAIEDAACLAAGISDRGQRRGLSVARMVRSVVGAGGHDLCPGSGGHGSRGDRRYVGGQRNHDGYVQPDLQHGRRFGGSDAAFVRGLRPCHVSGNSLPCGTGAGAAVRLCPVVPKILAGSGILGVEA